MMRILIVSLLVTVNCLVFQSDAHAGPLKVYLLVGQSNMQGHAHVRTLDHIGMDPKTAPILNEIRNADGTDRVFDNIWISSLGSADEIRNGKLTTGYGAAGGGPKIGPELTFGIYTQKEVNEPILIIKTAWGGKSLHTDFRPPSAGPYVFNDQQLKRMKDQNKDIEAEKQKRVEATGVYYRLMMEHIKTVLADIGKVYPDYDQTAGYELSGFVWFQGWNDMVAGDVYPNRNEPGGYDQYSTVLADFIRDVRKDLSAPNLPFVIGVMGAGGPVDKYGPDQKRYASVHSEFRNAMAAPASLPEFQDNVTAVLTENSWDLQLTELTKREEKIRALKRTLNKDETLTADQRTEQIDKLSDELFSAEELAILKAGTSNAAYHYLGSAKILTQIGKSFAEALGEMSRR